MEAGKDLDALFKPRVIAVIGASQDVTKIGGRPLQFLQRFGYDGALYPVNKSASEVQSLPAYASIADVPEAPDLAVIAVPAAAVPDTVDACAARGVRCVVILTSGFLEMGAEGAALQERLRATTERTGIRIVGPNCLGAVSVASGMTATFSIVLEAGLPTAGSTAIVSQSGNLGSVAMRMAGERGIGVSQFLATGNECDVDVADGIAWLARDPATSVILCCIETCRNASKLVSALQEARRAGKPVIVLKIGQTAVGQAAAASHTGALAGSDAIYDAVFRRAGAIRVRSIEQLVDLGHAAALLFPQRLPKGRRVALLAASGGFGVMMADAASAVGLEIPEMAQQTQERILETVPYASPRNPVDATAQMSSRPEILESILDAVVEDPGIDATLMLLSTSLRLPRLRSIYTQALRMMRERHPQHPILICSDGPPEAVAELNATGIPVVAGIDAACAAMGALARLGESRSAPMATAESADTGPEDITPLDPEALRNEAGAKATLAAAGIPVLPERLAKDKAEAVAAAEALGYPVVLKIVSEDLPHKTEVGGVIIGLKDSHEVEKACADMLQRVAERKPSARIDGVLVAPMATGGTELILGATRDPIFGPVVMVGLGGIFAEVVKDVALDTCPVNEEQAMAMLRSLKTFPVLDGARGRPRADLSAAAAVIAALSRFAMRHREEIAEIDINPLMVMPEGKGAVALDALLVGAPKT